MIGKFAKVKPQIRHLDEMKKVLYDKKWLKTAQNFEVYYMYRGLKKKDGLRYDITVIPPSMLGREFVKTKGHYHIGGFPELYVVLEGRAIYLIQKAKGRIIKDVFAVKAQKGDVVIVPKGYGHVTINPKKETLKMGNWVKDKGESDYRPFEEMQGAGYYFTKTGWQKNKNYKVVPPLRFQKPLKKMPENLDFLKDNNLLKQH
jgi:glucose-6-phosphate isomerase